MNARSTPCQAVWRTFDLFSAKPSLLFTITIRRLAENLSGHTLGWVKHNYLNALIELEQQVDRLVVRFSRGFLQQFGLFQLVPGIGYVDW